ncbi:MAG: pilus assembly protein [Acidobacteria bacterium]|nr:pilus assembly protein [Acidobacteriota bacterium]
MALLCPWVLFLFVGALDWGFYAYSMISVETAARSAAAAIVAQAATTPATTAINSTDACNTVLAELSTLTNVGTSVTACNAAPVVVSASQITNVDGATAVQVALTYTTPQLIPIPGLLAGQFTITRVVKMRFS